MCDHGPVLPPGLRTQQSTRKVKRTHLGHGATCASPFNGITECGDPPAEETLWAPDEDPQVPLCQVSPSKLLTLGGTTGEVGAGRGQEQGPGGRNGKSSLLQQWARGSARSLP